MSVIRCACFTINNYTLDDFFTLGAVDCQYLIVGAEVGASGTPHLQGYIEFKKATRFTTARKLLGGRAHIEIRKGPQEKAIDYCKKDGDWTERGERKIQGDRVDLDRVRELAHEGGMRAVSAYSNLQQIHVAEKYLTYNEEKRDWKPTVTWIWGPTGTGKSRKAREMLADVDYYTKNDGAKWWPGYDAHEAVIIDDFRDSWFTLTEMLSLLDRYEKVVEFKGGYRQFLARQIIVTSAFPPRQCYKNTGEAIEQLIRRIDTVIQLGEPVDSLQQSVADVAEVAG